MLKAEAFNRREDVRAPAPASRGAPCVVVSASTNRRPARGRRVGGSEPERTFARNTRHQESHTIRRDLSVCKAIITIVNLATSKYQGKT